MEMIFIGQSIIVRKISKRGGDIAYGLCRPYGNGTPILEYSSLKEANFIARYAEEHGGSLDSLIRHAAKDAWNKEQISLF